jgi:leucyl-tRNA synthetase
MDTFMDSSWYWFRYLSPHDDTRPIDPELADRWTPVDMYTGGIEHAILHLLYARFFTKALRDLGYVNIDEPFRSLRNQGMILGSDNEKMSKSRGNVVNPDQYIDAWGADTFRTYLMFLGPFEEGGDFRDQSIAGVRRFLDRLWVSALEATPEGDADPAVLRKLHQVIRKVGDDIQKLSYNTAIAAMMEYMNVLRRAERTPHVEEVRPLVQLVSPFAPFIAEELWERLGGTERSVFDAGWPVFDPALAAEDLVTLAVQVGGKMRGTIQVTKDITQDEALAQAMAEPNIAKFITATPKKVIFVPGRLLNVVV